MSGPSKPATLPYGSYGSGSPSLLRHPLAALAVLAAVGVTVAGYLLGSSIPGVDRYLLPIVGVIVVVSLLPVVLEVRRSRRAGAPSRRHHRDGAAHR